ncbi:hypothetical protein ACH61_00801 [Rathayibacter tanaceti]|uniref:Uncharacterized protein n=1 Tax=Rathayibacter tanaceti TaxID=1671680 RepID=A0A162GJ82_9MICO|nr:hypothetical protein ACH61_00801 [Rathayibacter tanaceti]
MPQPRQRAVLVVLDVDPCPRAAARRQPPPARREQPPGAVVPRDHEPLTRALRVALAGEPSALADRPVPALALAGEQQLPPVGEHKGRAVVLHPQPHLGHRGPARTERPGTLIEGVVGALPPQRARSAGEPQIDLGLEEVPGGRVHRVVRVAGRRRRPVHLSGRDRDVLPGQRHPRRPQREGQRTVRDRGHRSVPARRRERVRDAARPLHVLVVRGQPRDDPRHHAVRVQMPPPALLSEIRQQAPQPPRTLPQLVVRGRRRIGERPQILRPRGRGPPAHPAAARGRGLTRPDRTLLDGDRHLLGSRPDRRVLLAEQRRSELLDQVPGVLLPLPLPRQDPAPLLLRGLVPQPAGRRRDLAQPRHQLGRVCRAGLRVLAEHLREPATELRQRRHRGPRPRTGLPLDHSRRVGERRHHRLRHPRSERNVLLDRTQIRHRYRPFSRPRRHETADGIVRFARNTRPRRVRDSLSVTAVRDLVLAGRGPALVRHTESLAR